MTDGQNRRIASRTLDDMALWAAFTDTVTPLHRRAQAPAPAARIAAPSAPARTVTCLDLHGYTVQTAYERTMAALDRAGARLVVIPGRGGRIAEEFAAWVGAHPAVRRVEALHGGGAFRLHLRRVDKTRR